MRVLSRIYTLCMYLAHLQTKVKSSHHSKKRGIFRKAIRVRTKLIKPLFMSKFVRQDAWAQGGGFKDQTDNYTDLYWYAKGVGEMQSRALNDPNSWWFFAAIHGVDLNGWAKIQGTPKVPTLPVPDSTTQGKFWNQCQHSSWFFPPWHRGYLIALEAQVRTAIISLGGPSDWALPYWNYFENPKMPPAFQEQNLPDKTPNPLFVYQRFGRYRDEKGNIYIPKGEISKQCQQNKIYTNKSRFESAYGGGVSGFIQFGNTAGIPAGDLENNPHNNVHTLVGGRGGNPEVGGLMGNARYAALDPIFYLHHSNIDRMWAAWNSAGKQNPTDVAWLNGPTAQADRKFVMPMPNNVTWTFTPKEVSSLSEQSYGYDNLTLETSPTLLETHITRLQKLGIQSTEALLERSMETENEGELVGATEGKIQLGSTGAKTTVKLDKSSWENVPKSLMRASVSDIPDKVYVCLENVRGDMETNMLNILVNQQPIKSFSLFGLQNASEQDGHHGGSGLTFVLDITDIIDAMHLENALDIDTLDISIETDYAIPTDNNISVERIGVYRVKQ